jgi:pyruvate dehydrogenase E2 component (dihydrolipoamide acetyltransferase)
MKIEIRMPDLATTSDEVTLSHWLVEVGGTVALGQPLLEIETDKATMDVESVAKGVLREIRAQPGERVAVGQVIAVIESEAAKPTVAVRQTSAAPSTPPAAEVVQQKAPAGSKGPSLFARNRAARRPEAPQPQAPEPEARDPEVLGLSAVQREVARRMQQSTQTVPHFYLTTSANAEHIASLRAVAGGAVAWDAYFVLAAARALKAFDRMQLRLDGQQWARNPDAIGVAVDVDGDLFVVSIEQPAQQSVEQISAELGRRVERIRQGDADARRLGRATKTITNLGAEQIESFQAVINPPEAAILAVGRIAPAVVATSDRQIAIQTRVALSLSADHRVVNGKYAAQFLGRLVHELETL